jgi:predicted GNAT superfamily acetyltransferase
VLTPRPRGGDVVVDVAAAPPPAALIEIPEDMGQVATRSPDEMAEWRAATRAHFQWALGHGYAITALRRDAAAGRAFYVLRDPGAPRRAVR